MIIPDTNVVSELTRPLPAHAVERWLERQQRTQLFLAAPVFAELLFGLRVLPAGKRKKLLQIAIDSSVRSWFGRRLLAFEERAADRYASIMATARTAGRPIGTIDGQIAAIASAHDATVATRDTAPFLAAGVPTINPWQSAA